MRISKTAVLVAGGLFLIAGLGLMFVSAADKDVVMDMNNAVQHFDKVKIISPQRWRGNVEITGTNYAEMSNVGDGLLGIKIGGGNLVLSSGDNNSISDNWMFSSILGGEGNKLQHEGSANVGSIIMGGESNLINNGDLSSILGGKGNKVDGGSDGIIGGVILGGEANELAGDAAVIVGGSDNKVSGKYGVALGVDNVVEGENSVGMGQHSKVTGKNSFLWNDGEDETSELSDDDVFAVSAKNGMVIGQTGAYSFAKLTVGGPMVMYEGSEELSCDIDRKGVMKAVNYGSGTCFCSCDGENWNSMIGGKCIGVCNRDMEPKCGDTVIKTCIEEDIGTIVSYSGSCEEGEVVNGTGAYIVGKDDTIYWSCQTVDGTVKGCTGALNDKVCKFLVYMCKGGDFDKDGAYMVEGTDQGLKGDTENKLYSTLLAVGGNKCAWVCDSSESYYYYNNDCQPLRESQCSVEIGNTCEAPATATNTEKGDDSKYVWDCVVQSETGLNIVRDENCTLCKEGYEPVEGSPGECKPVEYECNHCASSGFPYCFPIDFSSDCRESNYH